MSQHSLRPRAERFAEQERRQEQQNQARHHRLLIRVLEARLHDHYRPIRQQTEEVYGGAMNKRPEFSESVTGCDLTGDFTAWLEDHGIIDHEEVRRRRETDTALDALKAANPYAHCVIDAHHRTGRSRDQLAKDWEQGDNEIREAYAFGIEFLLVRLGGTE